MHYTQSQGASHPLPGHLSSKGRHIHHEASRSLQSGAMWCHHVRATFTSSHVTDMLCLCCACHCQKFWHAICNDQSIRLRDSRQSLGCLCSVSRPPGPLPSVHTCIQPSLYMAQLVYSPTCIWPNLYNLANSDLDIVCIPNAQHWLRCTKQTMVSHLVCCLMPRRLTPTLILAAAKV